MQITTQQLLDDDWATVLALLPEGWQEQAKALGALKFGRKIKNAEQLLRILLQHFCNQDSMRTTVVKGADIVEISDVALLKRINKSGEWLRWMTEQLITQAPAPILASSALTGRRLLAIDGSVVSEPRAVNATWRLHYAFDIRTLSCYEMTLTSSKIGESLTLFQVQQGDVVLCDRGFTNRRGINHILDQGGDVLARMNLNNLPLHDAIGDKVQLLPLLRTLSEGQCGEWSAVLTGSTQPVPVRMCAYRKTGQQQAKSEQRLKKETSKRARVAAVKPETLEMAAYVVVVTTLKELDADGVLALYRHRWQVELAFKRLKSLLGFGHLKKKDPEGAKAWLQGKLLVACLIEQLIALGEHFSPETGEIPTNKPAGALLLERNGFST
ncbi:IS4 family transposase [Iodobacter sp.]|uniref:IS4 family transposase n=1 Tax=Iodobacter sp. TaxID=1915058 RepID=UPI0025F0C9BA|nr:IS4 family transposase [Iodobacter sp.]